MWIVDAHRDDGKRYVVRADEILTAFLELQSATFDAALRADEKLTVFMELESAIRAGSD